MSERSRSGAIAAESSGKRGRAKRRGRLRSHLMEGVAPSGVSLQALAEPIEHVPEGLRARQIEGVNRVLGNRQASRVVARIQRHAGHAGPEDEGAPLARLIGGPLDAVARMIQRAEMPGEQTTLATVNAAGAPLDLSAKPMPVGFAEVALAAWATLVGTATPSLGPLAAGDSARILEWRGAQTRIHIETGAQAGKIGWVPFASLAVTAAPTSQRNPTAGAENAYTDLQAALAAVPPVRRTILFIIQTRMTMAQHQQLLAPANAEWASLMGMAAITANDIIHILSVVGARLQRKLTEYTTKGGNTIEELRLAFATATDLERTEVANNDALVGLVRARLSHVHPEIVFGTALAAVYPPDGKLATLKTTHPELVKWFNAHVPKAQRASYNLNTAASARAQGFQLALADVTAKGAKAAKATIMNAVMAAPRGAALAEAERAALDQIEEAAYQEGTFTPANMQAMFVTRWGRPFKGANPAKTFLHRIWSSLEPLPMEHILLNNVLSYFDLNTNPKAAGAFTDFLSSAQFGRLVSNRPKPEILHAVGPQTGKVINVLEPTLDLLQPNHQLAVMETSGVPKNVRVKSVDVATRRVRLKQSVNVDAGADLAPPEATAIGSAPALRITAPAAFYADNAGVPNTGTVLGTIQPGNIFSQMSTTTVGPTAYSGGQIKNGPLAGTFGWIVTAQAAGMGQTTEQARFEWTARHEMGHALDLQLNGYSRFSGPSAAGWRKYQGNADWLTDLINTAAIPTPDTNQVLGGVTANFRLAAGVYSDAVQTDDAGDANPQRALTWLTAWVTAGGSQNVHDVVTQFSGTKGYFWTNNVGLPALGGRIFAAHYNEYMSANAAARTDSLAAGISPYAYTCTYEFYADHYAGYTGPGTAGNTYARAVPEWALNFFDRMVGVADAGPRVGMDRKRMGA